MGNPVVPSSRCRVVVLLGMMVLATGGCTREPEPPPAAAEPMQPGEVRRFLGHEADVTALSLSADGVGSMIDDRHTSGDRDRMSGGGRWYFSS